VTDSVRATRRGSRAEPLLPSKTSVPELTPDTTIERSALLALLRGSADHPIVSVVGPAGYGKSTVLAQWAASDGRPFAWVTLDERDGDPVLLLRYVLAALEQLPAADDAPETSRPRSVAELVRRVAALLRAAPPAVLVIDDVHTVGTAALDALGTIAREVPTGSQLVLSGRAECTPLVARRRGMGDLVEVGQGELALTESEGRELLERWDAALDEPEAAELVRANEGWAAGLYLAVLALRSGATFAHGETADRFVHDFLQAEHLRRLDPAELAFLRRSSVLDRMRADLCDAVLDRHDSEAMLARIEASNLFLVPLDHERRWYRYHEVFRAVLFDDLERTEPGAARELRLAAAAWCEAHALPEDAMAYALASRDLDRAARLVVALAFPLYRAGRVVTLERWFGQFDDGPTLQRYPQVAVLGALVHALRGRAFQAERWLDAAANSEDAAPSPDGSTGVGDWVAAVEALLCRHGPEQMHADATAALLGLGPLSPFRAPAMLALAYATLMSGDADGADVRFEEAHEAAAALGATFAGTTALAQRVLLALDGGDHRSAAEMLARTDEWVEQEQFRDYSTLAIILAARARLAAASDDRDAARRHLLEAQRLRPSLTHAHPYYAVSCLLEQARAYAALDDAAAGQTLLVQAADVLRRRPDLGVLGERVAELRAELSRAPSSASGWEATLTAAELRLLPLLTTHLTFREIGERLFLSRNTVKTQAISIYRKLGASSRGEAVERAVELGLVELHDPVLFTPTG
jgi:LuxR family maltose regulon positive regulatory protein